MKKRESILEENKDRFVLFPIKQEEIWQLYKQIENNFWFADKISFDQDIDDFQNKLNEEEKVFVQNAICILLLRFNNKQNDAITRFIQEMQYPEARCFLGFQIMMSNIHLETYSVFSETFIGKKINPDSFFTELINSAAQVERLRWIVCKFVNEPDFSKRLVAYTAIQRIFCTSLFPVISSFKERGLLSVFTMLTTFIYKDEGLFTDFALSIYSQLTIPLAVAEERKIIDEAVAIEHQLIKSFSNIYASIGVNPEELNKYVLHIADSIAGTLPCHFIYGNQPNPYKNVIWQRSFIKINPNKQPDDIAGKTFSLDTEF